MPYIARVLVQMNDSTRNLIFKQTGLIPYFFHAVQTCRVEGVNSHLSPLESYLNYGH